MRSQMRSYGALRLPFCYVFFFLVLFSEMNKKQQQQNMAIVGKLCKLKRFLRLCAHFRVHGIK